MAEKLDYIMYDCQCSCTRDNCKPRTNFFELEFFENKSRLCKVVILTKPPLNKVFGYCSYCRAMSEVGRITVCGTHLSVEDNAVDAGELLRATKISGLKLLDPGFCNTALCRSSITFIDGDRGILRYRGYPIEQLAEKSTFLEVAFLLIHGELPTESQFRTWSEHVMSHTYVHENLLHYLKSFRYDAHPMGMFISALAVMSTYHADANPALVGRDVYDTDFSRQLRNKQIYRILGKLPTVAACAMRHRIGRPYNYPDATGNLSYTENFLAMMDKLSEREYRPHPVLARAMDVLFIVHADHELNCSTAAMRHLASTRVDPYTAIAGAAAALYGPLHGGASEGVVRMLERIGCVENIPGFLDKVRRKEELLIGFGHRVYRSFDPRAAILKKYAADVFEVVGKDPLTDVAIALETAALHDEYFVSRKLYPNVDFYSGLIYRAMGFPLDFFPLLFALPRTAGWLAHWCEELDTENSNRIRAGATFVTRPGQVWTGSSKLCLYDDNNAQAGEGDCAVNDVVEHFSSSKKRRAVALGMQMKTK